MTTEFKQFNKIYRFWEQNMIVTEKIDGTNALIYVSPTAGVLAGSRNRWITPSNDHYEFAKWVEENTDDLQTLGEGYHYGEWWGRGIQHGYGMPKKVFSLFDVSKWSDDSLRPKCCDVVPVVYEGDMYGFLQDYPSQTDVPALSLAASKYGVDCSNVEGLMLYFTGTGKYMKHVVKAGRKQNDH